MSREKIERARENCEKYTMKKRAVSEKKKRVFFHRDGNSNGHGIDGAETEPQQNCMLGKSSSGSKLKWLKKILSCLKRLLSQGYRRLCHAFRRLLSNPTVKGLVVSLATDEAFLDAILGKTSLQELIPYIVNYVRPLISKEAPDLATAKVIELIKKFLTLVLFQTRKSDNPTEENKKQMEEEIISSLLLTVVIFLIMAVVVVPIP